MLAVVRPSDWNFPLFFHIAGAMLLVASLVVALYAVRIARERGDQPAAQFLARVLLWVTLPSYLVMRIFAQIIESKEKLDKANPSWLGVGFIVSDLGFVLLLAILIMTGLVARRTKKGVSVAGSGQLRATGIIMGILITAYVVAIWAMTTKPN
jgi:branched-subunit amino acid ABC-type transport system permease component